MQNEWLYLCIDTMIAHIPQKLETGEGREYAHQLFDHYMTASDLLTARFQTRVQGLSGDDAGKAAFEQKMGMDFNSLMHLLERTAHYAYRLSANILVVYRDRFKDEGFYDALKENPNFPHEYLDALG